MPWNPILAEKTRKDGVICLGIAATRSESRAHRNRNAIGAGIDLLCREKQPISDAVYAVDMLFECVDGEVEQAVFRNCRPARPVNDWAEWAINLKCPQSFVNAA